MADITRGVGSNVTELYKDMGGYQAKVVYVANTGGGGGGGGGDASAANQATGNTSLASIDSKTPTLVNGAQPVSFSAPTNATTTAYAASLVVKASAGILYGLSGFNSKTSSQFIQIHDSATLPAENAVPKVLVQVAASSAFSLDFGTRGRSFASGIVVCNSSTGPTKTIGSADCWFDGQVA